MLILSRKTNESIIIDGRIVVKVLRVEKDTVKLGIQAPAELSVHREEIHQAIQRSRQMTGGAAGAHGIPKSPQAQVTPLNETTVPEPPKLKEP